MADPSETTAPGSYGDFEPERIKHLEMIQLVIGRLGNDSFLIKGSAITVAAAFLGFAANLDKEVLAVAALGPTALFWVLDAYYLWSERCFRVLFELVRTRSDLDPFFMAATDPGFRASYPEAGFSSLGAVVRSPTLWRFYGAIMLALLVMALVVKCS